MRRSYITFVLFTFMSFWLLSSNARAQELTVSGKIIEAGTGKALAGVNVFVLGTTTGASSDAEGHYSVTVPSGSDTLRFSYVGFETKKIAINDRSTVNVGLKPDTKVMDEVFVLGYTEQSKEESTSSVSHVSSEQLNDVTTTSTQEALQGNASGVYVTSGSGEPGSASDIRIRGTGSISAGGDPLYVVDGVIGGTVDPNNIKSLTVLKDASATALYGSRAANGVVVIQTKSGKADETKISVSSTVGWNKRSNGNFEVMNSSELYSYQQMYSSPILDSDYKSTNTDWQDLAFRKGMTTKYGATASGGSEKTTFYLSGNYYKEEGTLISTQYERFNGRINVEHQFTDKFNIKARVSGQYNKDTNNPAGALYQSYMNMPWDNPYSKQGEVRTGREKSWIGRENTNFLYTQQYNFNRSNSKHLTGNIRLEYDLTDWLYISSTNRMTYVTNRSESFSDRKTSAGSTNDGELYNLYSQSSSFLTSNLLNFDYGFGEHSLSGVLGYEYERNYRDNLLGTGVGIFSGLEIQDVTAEAFSIGGMKSESEFVSGLSQLSYDYQKKYFLKLSYRFDASSRFGGNNRSGNFYSAGGSWILSNEDFMNDVSSITNLKLRASYGTTGNAQIGNYLKSGLYTFSVQYNGMPASSPERIENPDLTWEVAKTTNVGFDLSLYDRLDFTVDWYQKTNEDLLQNVPLPGTTGYESVTRNIGSVRNHGLELGISSQNIQSEFSWTTDFNISFNKSKVLSLNNGEDVLNGLQRIMEGNELRTWYMRKWAGVDPDNGDPLWIKQEKDKNGNVISEEKTSNYSEATLQDVGSASPDFNGGFRNVFSYRNWRLNTFFTFVYGNEVYHSARELFDSDGAYATYNQMVLKDDWSRWQEPGDNATHPKPIYGGNNQSNKPSSRYLEDGSYIRLRNISLSYSLPKTFATKIGMRSASVSVSADNLITWTDFSGMDPQVGVGGYANTKYPISKKYLVGIELGF